MDDQDKFSALSNPTRRKILAWMRDIAGASGEGAPGEVVPGEGAPGQGAPGQGAPGQSAPNHDARGQDDGGGKAGAGPAEVCVSEIQRETNLSQSTVSAYMAALERAGLVTSERRGQWTFFRRDERAISDFARKIAQEL